MHRIITPWTLGLLLATIALPAKLAAQGHPNIAIGLSPESTYDSSGIDNVSLFSGALSIGPIPLGPRYPVNSTLSYGLNAVYNANIWRYVEHEVDGQIYVEAVPSRSFNLGAGWLVTLGELYHPGYVYNETDDWLYMDPSGGTHKLYDQLHNGENDGAPGVRYTRDNSFVRMTELGDFNWQRIETPDGLRRTFVKRGSRFRLEEIKDRFGNWVKIRYSEAGQLPAPPSPWDEQQRITDSQGRAHWIYMIDRPWTGLTIDSIDFEGPNGGRLAWTFDHWVQNRDRSCKDTSPDTGARIAMPLLIHINRPDGSKFEMVDGGQPAYWDHGCDEGMYDRPGMISKITLPTGGSIRYDYQRYDFPGGGHPPDYYQSATGVKTRRTHDRDGTLVGTTAYYTLKKPSLKEMETVVVQPTGTCSRHFFEAKPDPHPGTGAGWDYGLPYIRRLDSGGRFPSSQIWSSHSGGTCTGTHLRTKYLLFDHDSLPNLGNDPSNYYNTNRRLKGTRTIFHDAGSKYIDVALSGYDGVGHYRTSTTTGTLSFTNDRTTTTNFNPSRAPSTPWPVNDPWILETFAWTRAQEPGAVGETTTRVDYDFDTNTGALICQRVLRTGNIRSGADIVTEYKRTGAGNVWQVRTRGGDGAGLPTGSVCAGNGGAGANFTYAHGVAKTTRPIGTNGALLGYLTYDADIDPGTGWVTAVRDPSGLTTSYTYDALGRVKTVTPQEGASSSTTYTHGSGSSAARIRTTVTGAGTTLSDSIVIFDGLGRALETQRRTPDHGWVSTHTTYDAAGRVTSQSLANDPSKKVRYFNYDAFGRPGIIRPPEGSGHDVLLSYTGPHDSTRSVKVGEAGGKVYETWHYNYNGYGQLMIVTEPDAAVGQESGETLRASYGYDVAGRLTKVRTVDGLNGIEQVRRFFYDNRGFLLQERHPELGPGTSPTGHFNYSGYDALGNPGRVENSGRDLRFTYDPFGRLTQVRDGKNDNLAVKIFFYDVAAGAGKGKLAEARRYNRVTLPGGGTENIIVNQIYRYEGVAGALSSRSTTISHGGVLQFEEQYSYDAAGQLTGLIYPDAGGAPDSPGCNLGGCEPLLPPRTVTFTYNLGHLREVGGFTSGPITYHPDGSWATMPHSNGVTDQRTVQTSNPARTAKLHSTGANSNYNSGWFSYDGAGHITQMGSRRFLYDSVGRLVKTDFGVTAPEWEYGYDAFGNLKEHTQFDIAGDPTTRTFAIDVDKNRLASASYDAAGNLLTWGGGSYDYDASGNLQSPHANLVYLYTASDERIGRLIEFQGEKIEEYTLRSAGGQLLRQVRRDDSMQAGDLEWIQDYVWRGGQLLATVQEGPQGNAFKRHFTLNHLGSPALVTDWQGGTVARYSEAPFGEDMTTTGNQDHFPLRFTGHERDYHGVGVLDDLDYMHARHYTPYVGRFLQVDPVLGSTGSPQSWNRYAYVVNDPVNLTDPAGLRHCSGGGNITVTPRGNSGWTWYGFDCYTDEESGQVLKWNRLASGDLFCLNGFCDSAETWFAPPPGRRAPRMRDRPNPTTPPTCEETGTCPPPPCEATKTCPPPVTPPTKPECKSVGPGCPNKLELNAVFPEVGKNLESAVYLLDTAFGDTCSGAVMHESYNVLSFINGTLGLARCAAGGWGCAIAVGLTVLDWTQMINGGINVDKRCS